MQGHRGKILKNPLSSGSLGSLSGALPKGVPGPWAEATRGGVGIGRPERGRRACIAMRGF